MIMVERSKAASYQLRSNVRVDFHDEDDTSFSNSKLTLSSPLCITIDDDEDGLTSESNDGVESGIASPPSTTLSPVSRRKHVHNNCPSKSFKTNGSQGCEKRSGRDLYLETKVQEMEVELENSRREYAKLQEATGQLAKHVPEAIQRIKKVTEERDDLKIKLTSSQQQEKQQNENLVAQLKEIKKLKMELNRNLRQFEEEKLVSNEKVINLKIKVAAMESYKNEYIAAFHRIEEKETELAVIEEDNERLTLELCNTRDKLESSKKSVENLQSAALKLKRKNKCYERELSSLRSRIKNLEHLNSTFVKNSSIVVELNTLLLANTKNNEDDDQNQASSGSVQGDSDDDDAITEEKTRRMVTRSIAAVGSKPPVVLNPFQKISKEQKGKIKSRLCCDECPKTYVNFSRLRKHAKLAHNINLDL